MEELSGKEGESILLSSRVTGNSIELVIETFLISFLVSLLYNSSSSVHCRDDAAWFCSCLSRFYLTWALARDRLLCSRTMWPEQEEHALLLPQLCWLRINSQSYTHMSFFPCKFNREGLCFCLRLWSIFVTWERTHFCCFCAHTFLSSSVFAHTRLIKCLRPKSSW